MPRFPPGVPARIMSSRRWALATSKVDRNVVTRVNAIPGCYTTAVWLLPVVIEGVIQSVAGRLRQPWRRPPSGCLDQAATEETLVAKWVATEPGAA